MRPCQCDKPECRLCWLFHNDERYTKLWSIDIEKQSQRITEIKASHPEIPVKSVPPSRGLLRPKTPCNCRKPKPS